MRKILNLFLAVVLATIPVHAQFIIDSLGNVGIKTPSDTSYTLNTYSNTSTMGTISAIRHPTGGENPAFPWSLGVYARADHIKDIYSFGVRGQATNSTSTGVGRCFGVFGEGYGATDGYNYGVYGQIGSQNGAGVYGTIHFTLGQPLDQRYAGYFHGPVKVQGNLTVTGNISGVMVSAPSPSSGSSTASVARNIAQEQISNQLASLGVSAFYHEIPEPSRSQSTTADTAEVEIPLTSMEEQVLTKQHYGLDADQLEEIFPDLVYENEDGSKSINYVEMVPILVQAIKELKNELNELKGTKTAKRLKKATGVNVAETEQFLSLGQNKPNPFSTATDIEVSVPGSVQTAILYIYDLQGKKVQQVDITARGKQTIKVDATDLAEGMYLYSLIADGQVIQTRRMIIGKIK